MGITDVERDLDLTLAQREWAKIAPGDSVTFLGHQRRKDGSTVPVEVRLGAVDVRGERLFMAMARDVSAQRRAEDALRESEAYFRACFEGNSAAMAIAEADTTVSMVNDAYCTLSGYSRDEVVGMSWTRQIPPGDLERLQEYNRRRLSDPSTAPEKYEFTFYRRDGEIRHGLMSVALIPGRRKIVASFLDITERKLVEQRLRVSEERHRLLADNALDVVWTMGPDGSITYVSPSVEKLRGFTPEEAMRQPIDEIHPPSSQAISLGYLTKLYADVQAGRPPGEVPGRTRVPLQGRLRAGPACRVGDDSAYWMTPVEVASLLRSACMSAADTPEWFMAEPMNVPMAVERPVVPAPACIMVPPPIMPPPIPPMEMEVEPIIPFIVPSEASFIIADTIPDEDTVIPMVFAYCDMAAMDMP
jgi:PAS domain S-box-containing protein